MNVIIVQELNIMKDKQTHFEVLKKIQKKPESTQRQLVEDLGFSYMFHENYHATIFRKCGAMEI